MSSIKEKAKTLLSSNIYIEDDLFRLIRYRKNDRVRRQVAEISEIDPLRDFNTFRHEVIKLKESPYFQTGMFEMAEVGAESRYYGHLKALAEYAGVTCDESLRLQFPYIEHGIRFLEDISPTIKMRSTHCVVSQGEYLRSAISSAFPDIPQFCIGPYIQYAKSLLMKDKDEALERKLGKILLVFPAHSIETASRSFDEAKLAARIESMADEGFDNIVCCFYWNDVDSSLVDRMLSIGAIPVSAGMRGDWNFMRRLRSVIQGSTAAAGNSLGTHIGYCLHFGIPYRWVDIEKDISSGQRHSWTVEQRFSKTFNNWTTLDDSCVGNLFKRYWGGGLLLSPAEMKCLFDITKEALSLSHGWSCKFPPIYRELLDVYKSGSSQDAKCKYSILSRALKEKRSVVR